MNSSRDSGSFIGAKRTTTSSNNGSFVESRNSFDKRDMHRAPTGVGRAFGRDLSNLQNSNEAIPIKNIKAGGSNAGMYQEWNRGGLKLNSHRGSNPNEKENLGYLRATTSSRNAQRKVTGSKFAN